MFELNGKIVVLTGGAGILGIEMARGLIENGARVAIVDRDHEKCQTVTRQLGENAIAFACDIADKKAVRALHADLRRDHGEIDVLVNNAAAKSANFFAPFEEFPLEDWDEVMGVNVRAAMICCQDFGSAMARRKRGAIINTLSIYGIVAPDQRIYEGSEYEGRAINTPEVYSTSKAALWGMTRYLASYWGHCGVRVNAVTPGGARSGQNDTFVERYSARVPLGRMARPSDMAGAVCYLASDAASYVTGHNLVVDGGLSVW